ncbi:MAG: PP0621 family protein [Aquabacterium sp.]
MLKYLLIGLLVWLLVIPALKRAFGKQPSPRRSTAEPPAPPTSSGDVQDMVQCAHCGVHLPEAEAHHDRAGRPYCSAEHARGGPRQG